MNVLIKERPGTGPITNRTTLIKGIFAPPSPTKISTTINSLTRSATWKREKAYVEYVSYHVPSYKYTVRVQVNCGAVSDVRFINALI